MLFGIGAVGVVVRRNPLVMFMCIELMLNAVNLSFVAMSTRIGDIGGQTAVFFVLVVAAAEVVVGLGIIVSILRRRPGATADDLRIERIPIQRPIAAIMGIGIVGLLVAAIVSARDTPPLAVGTGLDVAGREAANGTVAGTDAKVQRVLKIFGLARKAA